MKIRSTFFTEKNIRKIRKNSESTETRQYILDSVKKWDDMSMDELWGLIYSSSLKRSHQVLTNGCCPACRNTVSYGKWIKDPFNVPWKVICPHCGEKFPKNDFKKYYDSGLDEHHEFRHELADKSLLYNTDAPDPADPKHKFGVDDGNGYYEGENRWLFIANYLMMGIWYSQICTGIKMLARAFILTGEKRYARKCGIMIDRIADLFPKFDYYEQGVMYEKEHCDRGYVSYWCDIVRQVQYMLLSYDAIFETIRYDEEFISFVVEKSERYKTACRKKTFEDIQINMETRIFKEAAAEKWKIAANFPFTENYIILSKMVLSRWPLENEVMNDGVYKVMWWTVEEEIKYVIEKATRANGLSGEKGFTGYNRIAFNEVARIISFISLFNENFLEDMLKLYPQLLEGIMFNLNAWMLCSAYPGCGDTGARVTRGIPLEPSYSIFKRDELSATILFSFESYLWRLYKASGDINIVKYMYNSENYEKDKIFTTDFTLEASPGEIQQELLGLIEKYGPELEQHSMDADKWKLAILHSGKPGKRRGAFLDYDSGGVHAHNDGMVIDIYAKGLDFMPDLGYPPVHRGGGWYSKFTYWYRSAAAHNTVIVDKREHRDFCYVQRDINGGQGVTSDTGSVVLWGEGSWLKAVAADDPMIIGERAKRFERLIAIVDVSEDDCYFLDVFRVKGGSDHTKLTRGFICELETNMDDFDEYVPGYDPYGMFFVTDKNPEENFNYSVDDSFKFIRDTKIAKTVPDTLNAEFKYTGKYNKVIGWPDDKQLSLMYHDLTKEADVITFTTFFDSYNLAMTVNKDFKPAEGQFAEEMLPGVAMKRSLDGEGGLESIFIGVFEPSDSGRYNIKEAKRLPVGGCGFNSGAAAFTVEAGSFTDLILAADIQNKGTIIQNDWDVRTDASLSILRRYKDGSAKLTMIQGSYYEYGAKLVSLDAVQETYETDI